MNATFNEYPVREVCVWEFRSVDGTQVVRSIHTARQDDRKYQHEYQRIVYRGPETGYRSSPLPPSPAAGGAK